MHDTPLIFTIAISLTLAFVFGFIAFKMRLAPIVGYLAAGITIGPHTPGLVANSTLAAELSELGIILMMFGVGLRFSTSDLLSVSRAAYLGAIPQIVLSTIAGAYLSSFWGLPWGEALFVGLGLSVASTIVVIGALEKRNLLADEAGKISIGWLLSQDLAVVFFLALVPALAPALKQPSFEWQAIGAVVPALGIACAKAAGFIGAMLFAGRKFFPWFLTKVGDTGSRELFTLFVIGVPIGIALLAAHLFSVSMALGAFLAGIVLNESELSHHAAAKALPLQDAFAVLFFVSTGMSFNPSVVYNNPGQLLCAVMFIVVFNPLISFLLLTICVKYKATLAGKVAGGLAQIGEFSMLLAALGMGLGLLRSTAYNVIVGAALCSITIFSLTSRGIEMMSSRLESRT